MIKYNEVVPMPFKRLWWVGIWFAFSLLIFQNCSGPHSVTHGSPNTVTNNSSPGGWDGKTGQSYQNLAVCNDGKVEVAAVIEVSFEYREARLLRQNCVDLPEPATVDYNQFIFSPHNTAFLYGSQVFDLQQVSQLLTARFCIDQTPTPNVTAMVWVANAALNNYYGSATLANGDSTGTLPGIWDAANQVFTSNANLSSSMRLSAQNPASVLFGMNTAKSSTTASLTCYEQVLPSGSATTQQEQTAPTQQQTTTTTTTSTTTTSTTTTSTTTTTATTSTSYTWSTGTWGACTGPNTSCSGGATQSRTVTCLNSSGAAVDPSFCTDVRPTNLQSCALGQPCLQTFSAQYYLNQCLPLGYQSSPSPHGTACSSPGAVTTLQWAGSDAWNNSVHVNANGTPYCTPGSTSIAVQNEYTCLGVCASGQWTTDNDVIGSTTFPAKNPYGNPWNDEFLGAGPYPHLRCLP